MVNQTWDGGKCSTRKVSDRETVRQFWVSLGWVLSDNFLHLLDLFVVFELGTLACSQPRIPLFVQKLGFSFFDNLLNAPN